VTSTHVLLFTEHKEYDLDRDTGANKSKDNQEEIGQVYKQMMQERQKSKGHQTSKSNFNKAKNKDNDDTIKTAISSMTKLEWRHEISNLKSVQIKAGKVAAIELVFESQDGKKDEEFSIACIGDLSRQQIVELLVELKTSTKYESLSSSDED